MFNALSEINWIAVISGTLAFAVLGGLWFTAIFGKAYAKALGREGQPQSKPAPIIFIGPMICGLAATIAMSIFIHALDLRTVGDGLAFGVVAGLGLLASTTVSTGINPNIPRPLFYGLISGSYYFVAGVIVSLILVAIR